MKLLLGLLKGEPLRAAAIATALLGFLPLLHVPDPWVAALGALVAAVLGTSIRSAVTPVTNAVAAVKTAAINAAEQAAEQLDPKTVGAVGSITTAATSVAAQAAITATDTALKDLGINRKAHK